MRQLVWLCALGALLAGPSLAQGKPEDGAQAAAESWLKLVDSGDYDASWDQAAKLFKGAVTKGQWKQAMAAARVPLGKLVSRKVKSREYKEQLPGAPDGKYVVIQFDTVFEKKGVRRRDHHADARPRWGMARLRLLHSLTLLAPRPKSGTVQDCP
jgi:Protein of unknown function (DUF4019)